MSDKDVHWIRTAMREIFSDDRDQLSSFRVMAMIGCISGCVALVAPVFGFSEDTDLGYLGYSLPVLFAGIYGGKAYQKKQESGKN
ncbi:MAG: hypothetical protein OXI07_05050 [Gammaproteobacteria bacterium]|nr:hypothetical protein [Gammaproteobacteria bacterium]